MELHEGYEQHEVHSLELVLPEILLYDGGILGSFSKSRIRNPLKSQWTVLAAQQYSRPLSCLEAKPRPDSIVSSGAAPSGKAWVLNIRDGCGRAVRQSAEQALKGTKALNRLPTQPELLPGRQGVTNESYCVPGPVQDWGEQPWPRGGEGKVRQSPTRKRRNSCVQKEPSCKEEYCEVGTVNPTGSGITWETHLPALLWGMS